MNTEQVTKLTNAARAIGYDFQHADLLWEALQAAGSPVQDIGHRRLVEGNKPLAAVGDAVLKLVCKKQGRNLNLRIGVCNCIRTFVTTPILILCMYYRAFCSTNG